MENMVKEMKLSIIQTFCDYNNAYILVRGEIAVTAAPATQIVLQKLMKQQ